MKKSDALKQKRAATMNQWQALNTLAETESRSFTEEENTQVATFRTELAALDQQIEAAMDFESRMAASAATNGTPVGGGEAREKENIKNRFSITKMFRDALDGNPLTGAEKEVQAIAEQENRDAEVPEMKSPGTGKTRVMVPLSFIRASQQTVTQDSGNYGGELVNNQPPRVQAGLEPKLWLQEMGATLWTGLSGGNIKLPVASSAPFEWLLEGASITGQKKTFTGPTLSPKRAGAAISLSNQLIMQSSVDVDNTVRRMLSRGWENAINSAAINGGGGAAPTGVLNYTGVNAAADVAAAAATFAKIVELQSLIEEDDSTEVNLGYILHPKLKAALKTKTKDAGSGRFLIEGRELDGYKFISTSLVPVGDDAGTPVYPLIFGDFSQLIVGQWGAVSFTINPYSEDLADSVRITVNTYSDVQIANPKAFSKNGFLTNA